MSSKIIYIICFVCFFGTACQTDSANKSTRTSGEITISVDESFKPLIDTEISVFEGLYPEAKINVDYKPEGECIKDFLNDSVDLVIVTRPLKENELTYFKEKDIPIKNKPIARDAVALIVHPSNKDTLMTMKEIRAIMTGQEEESPYEIVFDNDNSSLVHFIIDSVNNGEDLPKGTKSAKGMKNVVDYVADHEKALGVIGVSWVSDPYDTTRLSFLKKIRVVEVMSDSTYDYLSKNATFAPLDNEYRKYYFKPYLANIAFKRYALTRTVYFALREPYFGLGTGFANFLTGNKGQMIIYKSGLYSVNLNPQIRRVNVN